MSRPWITLEKKRCVKRQADYYEGEICDGGTVETFSFYVTDKLSEDRVKAIQLLSVRLRELSDWFDELSEYHKRKKGA